MNKGFHQYRAQKYAANSFKDGKHNFAIARFEEQGELKYHVDFRSAEGKILKSTYHYDPEKYGPLDALVDAALGFGIVDFDPQDLIGKQVTLLLRNETKDGRPYTNIKRIHSVQETLDDAAGQDDEVIDKNDTDDGDEAIEEDEDFDDPLDEIDEM